MELRILPMSKKEEFDNMSIIEVQAEFFLKELPDNNGKYHYRKSGMNVDEGGFVLFQYDKRIVAMATVDRIEAFEKAEGSNKEYYGAYYFQPSSIAVFDPITEQEIKNIWPNDFKGFNQVKYNLSILKFSKLLKLLTYKNIRYYNTTI